MYISRIAEDGRKQFTVDHLKESSEYAALLGNKFGLSEISRLATILHDLGKFSQEFVNYLEESFIQQKAGEKTAARGSVIHSTQGAKYIYEYCAQSDDLFKILVSEICALCIASHHGGLMDMISPNGETPLLERLKKESISKNYNQIIEIAEQELNIGQDIKDIFQKAENEIKAFLEKCKQKDLDCLFMLNLLTRTVYSCLVDADRYNAYCFENKAKSKKQEQFSWEKYAKRLEERISTFSKDTEINRIRSIVSDFCYCAASRPKGIYRLSVPTGGGKTLSSLRFALNHAKYHNAEHVIYVIPYLSIIDQTAKEIKKSLQYNENDNYILEHHSNFIIEEDKEKIQNHKLLTSRWDVPIIITTMVQFLESIYSARASDLRKFHNMANSVIIFDEVQSLPLKCIHLFNEAINYLYNFGQCTVLLCTATQPPLEETLRPLFLSDKPSLIPDMSSDFQKLKRTRLVNKTKLSGYTLEELRDFILEVFRREKNCLVILNTRRDAANLYLSLKDYFERNPTEGELFHLSTLMYPKHRLQVIEYIKNHNQEKIICISTQLIEAGVDISFKSVIRVISGLDSIIQAAGRCNRHGEEPNGKDVYIVNLHKENLQNLPEIKAGADVTYNILANNPSDLMNEIQNFYKNYYYREKNKMSYPTDYGSIYELLSHNDRSFKNMLNYGNDNELFLRQAFKTASDSFYVIDQRGVGVVVSNDESNKLISEYIYSNLEKKNAILRKLSEYSVTLYSYQLNELMYYKALTFVNEEIYVLDSYFYDDKLGVVFDIKHDSPII